MNKKTILIAQSQNHWLELLQHIFSNDNIILFLAQDVHKAITILKNKSIDLIITGLQFSDSPFNLEGIQLIKESLFCKPPVPVIVLTAGPTSLNEQLVKRFPNIVEVYYKAIHFSIKDFHDVILNKLDIYEKDLQQPIYIDEEIISFHINGRWIVTDFINFFNCIRNAYTFFVITSKDILENIMPKQSFDDIWHFVEIGLFETKANPLEVKQVSYASPGNISFKGLGEPIREVKNLFESIILIVIKWKQEKAELTLKHQQIKEKEIELARKEQENNLSIKKLEFDNMIDNEIKQLDVIEKRIDLMKKLGYDNEEIRKLKELMYQNVYSVAYLISNDKISKPEIE